MPIRPEYRGLYGKEWRAYRLALIAIHGPVCRDCREKVERYINLAHTEHDPKSSNVALLCPACHNRHDAAHRLAVWRRNRAKRSGQLWLLPEFEWAPFPAWAIPRHALDAGQLPLIEGDLWSKPGGCRAPQGNQKESVSE